MRPAGRLAMIGWAMSVALSLTVTAVFDATGFVRDYVPIALALTTTALGTLLPILHDNGMLQGAFGDYVFAAGAVGELFPILAIDSQFHSSSSTPSGRFSSRPSCTCVSEAR